LCRYVYPNQGQLIDPSRMISGRRAMTQSARRKMQNAHIPKRGRGKGRRADGEGSSQGTQPAQSHVVDQTQVEYLNYQDQIHDATDGGYNQQHILEHFIPVLDQDDIAAASAPEMLPDQPAFLEGPKDASLLSSYAEHVALPLWYNSNNVSVIFNSFKLLYVILIKLAHVTLNLNWRA